jgi:putative ABC transport system permease protein
MMDLLRQIATVTALSLRGLKARLWTGLTIVVGVACVVGVLLSMLSFSTGLSESIVRAGSDDRAIITNRDSNSEIGRGITRQEIPLIVDAPGIRKAPDGKPLASPEHLTVFPGKRVGDHANVTLTVRGIGDKGIALRPGFRLVAGRMFEAGKQELIVGSGARAQFEGSKVGDIVSLPTGPWKIVGEFTTNGDQIESQMLGDIETVLMAIRRNGFGSVIVQLQSPGDLATLKKALEGNPQLNVDVDLQSDFYARASGFTVFLAALAYALGGIMAVGAMFGTLNIMYSAVRSRRREIATLRALGFGGLPVAVSVVAEATLLAVVGGGIGAAAAAFLFSGGQQAMGTNVFRMLVTPEMIALGLAWAFAIALLGGTPPAARAARLPIVTALRVG